ncbi:MAG: hypothetical protein E7620_05900 [Ruminococcaceae bacterium]|nr:hypothetical protein [Oscillospiraceae bacterium]
MKKIVILDTTLCRENCHFSFKEKIEIARQLDRLNVDVIELPSIQAPKTDVLLVRTVSSLVKESILSVAAGATMESIEQAALALHAAKHPRIRIELSVSPVGMEYTYHKKPAKMLAWISEAVAAAKERCADVEFCALDATRAEADFLKDAIQAAVAAGACGISVCDNAGQLLPDDFAAFAQRVGESSALPVSVYFDDRNGLACAAAVLSAKQDRVLGVKTAVGGNCVSLEVFADLVKNCGVSYGLSTNVRITELHRIVKQIQWITDHNGNEKNTVSVSGGDHGFVLDAHDAREDVIGAVAKLGYDLSEEDCANVYEEFLRVASKKIVGERELEAIVASVAMQVPATYRLKNYVVNNGNIISSSAQITLTREDRDMQGVSLGDGPIDAAFLALEGIIGQHFELDDFQIQSVTEGTEAMGSALVKLRSGGKLYSGNGISTDIICASIRAYVNAVNKIVYEEASQS